jgi:hypothetical protein
MNAIIKWAETNAPGDERMTREYLVDAALDSFLDGMETQLGIGSN